MTVATPVSVPDVETEKWQPYSEYRESGVDWLGRIPSTWDVKKFSREIRIAEGQVDPEVEPYSSMPLIAPNHIESATGRLLLEETAHDQGAMSGKYLCHEGDVIYSKIRPALAKVVIAPRECLCSADMYPLNGGRSYFNPYLRWLLLSQQFTAWSILESDRVAMPKINRETLNELRIPAPSLPEQRAIAAFLDLETITIDALIAKKERLIELLREKRAALISHAVTRGLDPDAPMKDSGVDSLKEVPAHWKVQKLKIVAKRIIDCEHKTAPYYPDGEYLVARTTNVKEGRLTLADAKYTDHDGYLEWTTRGTPSVGDVLFTREAPAGEACLVPPDMPLCLGQRMVLIRPDDGVLKSEFLVHLMYEGIIRSHVELLSGGSTVTHLNVPDIGNMPCLIPPVCEQTSILEMLRDQTRKLDLLIASVRQHIETLRERRTALISAAVTGQIDVRGEAVDQASAD